MLPWLKVSAACLAISLSIALLLPQIAASEDGQFHVYFSADAPGYDYRRFDPPSLGSCQSRCRAEAQCGAFTYNRTKRVCFLKHGSHFSLTRHAEATTGTKIGTGGFSINVNRDAPGHDYARFDPPSLADCRTLCSVEANCRAFTYNVTKQVCFLKSKQDIPLIRHAEAITGVKLDREPPVPPTAGEQPATADEYTITGTGFTVSDDGFVLTNSHVVEQCETITIYEKGSARIKTVDDVNDLALLKIQGGTAVAKFGTTEPRLGGSVYAAGFPYSGVLSRSVNFTSGNVSSLSGIRNDTRYLQFTAPVQPGNSGGPLLDSQGHVVGVVTARLRDIEMLKASGSLPQNVNFAIRSELAKSFLKANGVEPEVAGTNDALTTEEIAKIAKSLTVQVICRQRQAQASDRRGDYDPYQRAKGIRSP